MLPTNRNDSLKIGALMEALGSLIKTQRVVALLALALASSACASLFRTTGEVSTEECDNLVRKLLDVPSEPPAMDLSGRWVCAFGNATDTLDIVQNRSTASIAITTRRDDLTVEHDVGQKVRLGGHIVAYGSRSEGGTATRLEADATGRVLHGRYRNGQSCGIESPFTCHRQ